MIAQRFRPVGWVIGIAAAACILYMISLQVATQRGRLEEIDRKIAMTKRDIRQLQTELGTRASLRQLERWNSNVLSLSAPKANQYLRDGHLRDAQKLLEEKARFRDLEHEYAANHIARLQDNTAQSIETSSLHLDLISELKRINSHICSIAYPILESAGALAATRIRPSHLGALDEAPR